MNYNTGLYNVGIYDAFITDQIPTGTASVVMIVPKTGVGMLGKFTQQTSEILEYDVDFSYWAEGRTDVVSGLQIATTGELIVFAQGYANWLCRVTLSGVTNAVRHRVTVRLLTSTGRIREVDFVVTGKDI